MTKASTTTISQILAPNSVGVPRMHQSKQADFRGIIEGKGGKKEIVLVIVVVTVVVLVVVFVGLSQVRKTSGLLYRYLGILMHVPLERVLDRKKKIEIGRISFTT